MPGIVCTCRTARYRQLALVASLLAAVTLLARTGDAQARPSLQACKIATLAAFARAAAALDLGCAASEAFPSPASEQAFQHGSMLWLAEWGTITVFKEDGSYDSLDDLYDPTDPAPSAMTPPTPDLLEPLQGFGRIWRNLGGPTSPLGWAAKPEQSYVASVQYFERGAVIQSVDGGRIGLATFNHARGRWAAMRSQ